MTERAKFKGVINLIIKDGDKTLLFFRNDGFFSYGGGWWVMPAGHIEQGETALTAAIREAKEELDIDILPEEDSLYINGNTVEVIGSRPYYVFNKGNRTQFEPNVKYKRGEFIRTVIAV